VQIVTDSGINVILPSGQLAELNIHVVPLSVTLDGKSYREGVDIEPVEFYRLLSATKSLPTTSQPSPGDFADTYRRLAAHDPDILSIHMSSGLSGTYSASQIGAKLVPQANIIHIDTKTLSAAAGWQVEAASRALKAGCTKEQILTLLQHIGVATDVIFSLDDLKYLIHGGRISHMKGLVASVLNIKPLIGVEKINGTYVQLGFLRTFQRAVKGVVDLMARKHALGSALRVQVVHAQNPEGAEMLHKIIDERFDCTWLPVGSMSLVLGAHTGPSMVGVSYATRTSFDDIPNH
jgi:DegV family protein with EDD domain